MSQKSRIEWTEMVWNPVTGCSKASPGCANCYAEKMAHRLQAMGCKGYENGFAVTLHPDRLDEPLRRKKPTVFFVCSMGDMFHEDVPDDFRDQVYAVMALCPQHTFLVLSKRAKGMADYWNDDYRFAYIEGCAQSLWNKKTGEDPSEWLAVHDLPNVWHGVTTENQEQADLRLDWLCRVPGKTFLSVEPMLSAIHFDPEDIECVDAVILGGESGHGARPMHPDWARSVRDQCAAAGVAGVPFTFKQWGDNPDPAAYESIPLVNARRDAKKGGRILDGHIHDDLPWKS